MAFINFFQKFILLQTLIFLSSFHSLRKIYIAFVICKSVKTDLQTLTGAIASLSRPNYSKRFHRFCVICRTKVLIQTIFPPPALFNGGAGGITRRWRVADRKIFVNSQSSLTKITASVEPRFSSTHSSPY